MKSHRNAKTNVYQRQLLIQRVRRDGWTQAAAAQAAGAKPAVPVVARAVLVNGTVTAASLFDVERYPTVWQMTSMVTGRTRASVTDIFRALFPCASITGAPKARTTAIIAALEPAPARVQRAAARHPRAVPERDRQDAQRRAARAQRHRSARHAGPVRDGR